MRKVIITAPSLDPSVNVSGVSSVAQFIIENNKEAEYIHFQLGKTDKETGLCNRLTRIFRSYRDWKGMLCEHKDALVHYSFPLSAPSIIRDPFFMRYARKHGRKMVVHVHGGLFLTARHTPWLLKKILNWVFSWNVPFIVLSEMEKEILQSRYGAKWVEVLPNCPDMPSDDFVRKVNEDAPITLGYLGRIEVNKGMTELLMACKKLLADGISFKLLFAGKEVNEREYIPYFEKELGGSFEYVGLVSGERKREFLKKLDIFVMPTYFEGLPMSLLETMSYGSVPLVTDVGSISTVVEHGRNGMFIRLKDVDSIVESVKYLHSNRDVLSRLGMAAKETIENGFSARKYVEDLNSIYGSKW